MGCLSSGDLKNEKDTHSNQRYADLLVMSNLMSLSGCYLRMWVHLVVGLAA
jgi:hypothetical protein